MHWLLIIWLGIGNGGFAMERFSTEAGCHLAAKVAQDVSLWGKEEGRYECIQVAKL